MITTFSDPFEALFSLQRALDARLESDWLRDATTTRGPYPPVNVFQQGDGLVAIIELPGAAEIVGCKPVGVDGRYKRHIGRFAPYAA